MVGRSGVVLARVQPVDHRGTAARSCLRECGGLVSRDGRVGIRQCRGRPGVCLLLKPGGGLVDVR